jgi:tetratricopeptide (TPR) repeat protein
MLRRLRQVLHATWAGIAVAMACFSTAASAQTSESCLNSPVVQTLVAAGDNTQLPYAQRRGGYEQAIKLCPDQPSLYHTITLLALQNHDFSAALSSVRTGLRLWPDNLQLQLDEAVALISSGHSEESLPILTHLPSSGESQFYLGLAERALGDHKVARQALSKAFDLGFQDPYVLYVLIEQDRDLHDKEAGLRDFQTLDARFPRSAWVHVVLGDAYMSRYEDSKAQSEYTQALAINPHLPVIHFQLGCLAFSHDDRRLAIEEFRKEIDLDPAFGDAYLYLGLTLRRNGKNQEALPLLERAVALEPNSPLPYRALAVVQLSLNQVQAATETLRVAKRKFPSEPAFVAQSAVLLKQMGRPAEAAEEAALAELLSRKGNHPHQGPDSKVESHGQSTANSPPKTSVTDSSAPTTLSAAAEDPPVQGGGGAGAGHSYAAAFVELRRCLEQQAVACTSSALADIRDPKILQTADYLELKAQSLALETRKQEALAAIQDAIEKDPSQPHYLITQGRIYLSFNEPVDAIPCFLKAAKLEPESPEPVYFLGTSFFLLAQSTRSPDYYHRALLHFQLALQVSPDYHRAEFMLGVINAVQSRLDEARTHLQRAIQLQSSNPYYHLHYGIVLKHEGDNRGAMGEMKTAERLNPSYALTHFELGTVYEKLGDFREAKKELEAARKLNPGLSAPYYHLGAVYAQLGRMAESKAAFERFEMMKDHPQQPNSDPVASAVSDEESEPPRGTPADRCRQ